MLRITGGKVYDPANGVNGVVKDICIADGRIVADVEGGRTIDATGMVVFPGGVDVHTHVAGGALNFARGADRRRTSAPPAVPAHARIAAPGIGGHDADHLRHRLPLRRHGLHDGQRGGRARSCPPSTRTRSCATRRSWTSPACVLMANNEIVLDLLEAGRDRAGQARRRLADLGGEGLRRQGGQPRRRRGLEVGQGRQGAARAGRRATARSRRRKIIAGLAGSSTSCGLPHPLHLHCNNLGVPGNVATTLETMKVLEGNRAHLAHLQFHAYGGDDWRTMRSEAAADRRGVQRRTRT